MNRDDEPPLESVDQPTQNGPSGLHPWEQANKRPSIRVLLHSPCASLQSASALARSLHHAIGALDQVRGRTRWQGYAWKWVITYSLPHINSQSSAAFAYLIPEPGRLQFVIPLNKTMLRTFRESDDLRRCEYFHKAVSAAVLPNEFAWPAWTVTQKFQVRDLTRLAKWKLEFLTNQQE